MPISLFSKVCHKTRNAARTWHSRHRQSQFIRSFEYRQDDVILVSYPRSGSTWLRFVIAHLLSQLSQKENTGIDFLKVQQCVPALSADAAEKSGVEYDKIESPRILRSHWTYTNKFPKVVYMLRDGRDVLVSFYYHFKKRYGYTDSLSAFIQSNIRSSWGEWEAHVSSWLLEQKRGNVCLIKYEDMLEAPEREVQRVAIFSNLCVSSDQISKAVFESSFEKMRTTETKNGLGYIMQGDQNINAVRKGRSGSWTEELNDVDRQYLKSRIGNVLIQTGYETSYDW